MKAIIVAYSDNHVIGDKGIIPWLGRVPADMRRVRELTTGQAIIMGRTTFESIGRPLPRRQNIILTSDESYAIPGVEIAKDLEEALALAGPERDSFIFGGARVYAESLVRARELGIATIFATEIHSDFAGDAKFPDLDKSMWREIERVDFPADQENLFAYSFVEYELVDV